MATWEQVSFSINACMDSVFAAEASAGSADVAAHCKQVLDALHDEQMAVTQKAIAGDDAAWTAQTSYFSTTAKRLSDLGDELKADVGYIADAAKAIDAIAALLKLVA